MAQTLTGAAQSWPTLRATEADKMPHHHPDSADSLTALTEQWPTPNAQVSNDGESPETWQARIDAIKAKGINGNGAGTPLAIAAAQWTTPQAHDATGGSPERIARHGTTHGDKNLADDVTAWATPATRDEKSGQASNATMDRNARPLNEQVEHWKTPMVPNGGRNGFRTEPGREGKESGLEHQAIHHHSRPVQGWAALALSIGSSNFSKQTLTQLSESIKQSLPKRSPGSKSSARDQTSPRPRLNPRFVGWLMGFPIGWASIEPTSLELSAMPSYLTVEQRRS